MGLLIEKYKKIRFSRNDLYFIEVISNKIIINNNYKSLLILNSNLEVIKEINIFKGLLIFHSYKDSINEKLLLYCPENGCCVYVNLKSYDWKIIKIPSYLSDVVFSDVYIWNENTIILESNNNCYLLDINYALIKSISYEIILTQYNFLNMIKKYREKYETISIRPESCQFIFVDNLRNFFLYDGNTNETRVFNYVYKGCGGRVNEIIFNDHITAVIVDESVKKIINARRIVKIELEKIDIIKNYGIAGHIFASSKSQITNIKLQNNNIIVAESLKRNTNVSFISIYKLQN